VGWAVNTSGLAYQLATTWGHYATNFTKLQLRLYPEFTLAPHNPAVDSSGGCASRADELDPARRRRLV